MLNRVSIHIYVVYITKYRVGIIEADKAKLNLLMKYGRLDCNAEEPNQTASEDSYPNPHNNYSVTTAYFNSEYQLSADETVALLGKKPISFYGVPKQRKCCGTKSLLIVIELRRQDTINAR